MSQLLSPNFVTSGLSRLYDPGNDRSLSRNLFRSYGTGVGYGSQSDTNVTFEVNGYGTFVRLGWGQTFGGYTIQPSDVVYKYNLASTGGCHYHGNDLYVPSGTYASFYFDYYVSPGAANFPSTNYLANFEQTGSGSVGAPNSNTGVWQRVGITTGPMNAGMLRMLLYPGACGGDLATSGYVLYKNPIVVVSTSSVGDVFKSFNEDIFTATNRVNRLDDIVGSKHATMNNNVRRGGDGLSFDGVDDYLSMDNIYMGNGNSPWTITAWVRTSTTVNSLGQGSVVSNSSGGPVYSMLGVNGGKIVYWTYQNNAWAQKLGSATVNDNIWHELTWVNNSNSTMTMYVDGVADASVANSTSGNNNPLDRIGGSWAGYFDGRIGLVAMYNSKALTATEVSQNFNAMRGRFGR